MIEILGRRTSGNVMKPLWAADELGLEYTQVDIGGPFGGNDKDDYRGLNPMGLVPTLRDGDLVLWESNTITRYLASRYGMGTLCPETPAARALAEIWMDWKLSAVNPMMTPIFWGLVRTAEADRDHAAIGAAKQRGFELWGMLDRHLADKAYVAGDAFTMGDIPLGPQLFRWYQLVDDAPDMPNLRAWYERLTERPAYRTHCMNPLE